MDAPMRVNWKSTVNDRFRRIAVNGKVGKKYGEV